MKTTSIIQLAMEATSLMSLCMFNGSLTKQREHKKINEYDHILQTNPRHREEESQNIYRSNTSVRQ